jgi:hypothetical protein
MKVLYIGGTGRSGCTILDQILGQLNGFFVSMAQHSSNIATKRALWEIRQEMEKDLPRQQIEGGAGGGGFGQEEPQPTSTGGGIPSEA